MSEERERAARILEDAARRAYLSLRPEERATLRRRFALLGPFPAEPSPSPPPPPPTTLARKA